MNITYHTSPVVANDALNALFAAVWPDHGVSDFQRVLRHSLAYICAYDGARLVGFVNVAWDGGIHAFLLDTTVHPAYQRRGIGRRLVQEAAAVAQAHGMHWLHVDYEAHLDGFYRCCGFTHTMAGLLRLNAVSTARA